MWAQLPVPEVNAPGVSRIVDPRDLDDNFYYLFQTVNGNLGVDNIREGGLVPATMLQLPRSLAVMSFDVNLQNAASPFNLFQLPVSATLLAIGVGYCYTANVSIPVLTNAGATTLGVLSQPRGTGAPNGWLQRGIGTPTIPANSPVYLTWSGGAPILTGLFFYLSFAHQQ